MVRLFFKILIFSIPFIILTSIYLIADPFMILYPYDDFNKYSYIHKNRDYVSTEMYQQNKDRYQYDSFIFGSSTALYISPSIWETHLCEGHSIFSFDASAENIVGIWSKIKYLDKQNQIIKNAIIVVDPSVFSEFVNNVPIFMKHYDVFPSSKFNFQYHFFLSFLDLRFLAALIHYKTTNNFYPYMNNFLVTTNEYYDPKTNEYFNIGIMNELQQDSIGYYENRKNKFPVRKCYYTEAERRIQPDHVKLLKEIRSIFGSNNTSYKVLICPQYDQLSFNRNDLEQLNAIFNQENVFDFSGINSLSQSKSNFYDAIHFKK